MEMRSDSASTNQVHYHVQSSIILETRIPNFKRKILHFGKEWLIVELS